MKKRQGPPLRRWALSPAEESELWSADTVSGWLLEACKVVDCCPPPRVSARLRTASAKGLLPQPTPLVLASLTSATRGVGPPTPLSSRQSTSTSRCCRLRQLASSLATCARMPFSKTVEHHRVLRRISSLPIVCGRLSPVAVHPANDFCV